jgi:hypothetical protein
LLLDVQVTYSGSEGSTVVLSGLSSDPGQGVIIAARDYERQFSAHFVSFFSHFQLQIFFRDRYGSGKQAVLRIWDPVPF